MIEGNRTDGYVLICDHCGEEADGLFDNFQDAVTYKKDADNGWRTIKDKYGDWCELCPACNTPEIIRELKGVEDV
jgi:hypothetical protein